MKIAVYNTDNAGCYWYRLYTPLQKIKDKVGGDFDYTFCPPSVDSLIDYDILILQRVTDALGIEIFNELDSILTLQESINYVRQKAITNNISYICKN